MTTRLPTTFFAVMAFATVSWAAAAQAPQSGPGNQPPAQSSDMPAQPPAPPQAQPSDPQQGQPSGQQQHKFSQAELDQLVSPIALYPDPLLSNVLMASTYPLDVVEAKRWLDKNKSLKGKSLKQAADKQIWDNSVKELTATPPVLAMMSDKLEWTEKLGDAVIMQQQDVMDSVQRLRARAQAEDQLKTTKQQKVVHRRVADRDYIAIEPVARDTVYVPYYNPSVYGAWAYADYPPYYWPGYYYGPDPLLTGLVFTAFAIGAWAIADNWWGGDFDWWHSNIYCCRNVHHHHRDRDRFAHDRDRDRRNSDQLARNRDTRNADRLNDRTDRRDRQATADSKRDRQATADSKRDRQAATDSKRDRQAKADSRRDRRASADNRRSGKHDVKRSSASQKRIANRGSVNRNHIRNQRASFGGHGRGSFAQQRGGMRSFSGGGGGRHFGGGGGGGGRVARGGGGGRRGR